MSEEKASSSQSRNVFYPLMILVGIAGNILSAFANLQAIYSTFGIFISTILIGVGVIGIFVNQNRITLRDGIMYALIWTMLIALAGAGYYILISRNSSVYGIVLDNANARNPVADVEVSLYIYSTGATNRVKTNANGEFQFDAVSLGEFDVIMNDQSIYSGETPHGLYRLIDNRVNTGRFYLEILGSTITTPNPTITPISSDTLITAEEATTSEDMATPIPESSILYEEDFEEGRASGWSVEVGNWEVITDQDGNKAYQGGGTSRWSHAFTGSQNWTDYAVSMRVQPISHGHIGIMVRTTNTVNSYTLTLFTDRIALGTAVNDRWVGATNSQCSSNVLNIDDWNEIILEVQGDFIRVSINGTPCIDAFDDTHTQGYLRLEVSPNTVMLFDDIRIWSFESDE